MSLTVCVNDIGCRQNLITKPVFAKSTNWVRLKLEKIRRYLVGSACDDENVLLNPILHACAQCVKELKTLAWAKSLIESRVKRILWRTPLLDTSSLGFQPTPGRPTSTHQMFDD